MMTVAIVGGAGGTMGFAALSFLFFFENLLFETWVQPVLNCGKRHCSIVAAC